MGRIGFLSCIFWISDMKTTVHDTQCRSCGAPADMGRTKPYKLIEGEF